MIPSRYFLPFLPIAMGCSSDEISGYGSDATSSTTGTGLSTTTGAASGAGGSSTTASSSVTTTTSSGGASATSSTATTTGGPADPGNPANCPATQPAEGDACMVISPCVYGNLSCTCTANVFACSAVEDGSGGSGGDDEPFGGMGSGGDPFGGMNDGGNEAGAAGANQ